MMNVHSAPEQLGLSKTRLARIKNWMQGYIDEAKLPGATTLVARHGEVVFSKTLGYGDLEKKKPLKQDSILRFYSMTKPITAVAVMILYEQGLFQLDDPISAFIPAFRDMTVYRSGPVENPITEPAARPITIQNLMTHTSGLTYGVGNEGVIPKLYVKHHTDFDSFPAIH
jgi:CubicO group peptidase (beta-lactamase class C family)